MCRSTWLSVPKDHPRLRGEHGDCRAPEPLSCLDHPRLRGEHAVMATVAHGVRWITPACAGSTSNTRSRLWPSRDHPRLRGEHMRSASTGQKRDGSPPPARGARGRAVVWVLASEDHPRLRGEHIPSSRPIHSSVGSPPPARGARRFEVDDGGRLGITPACAGSTAPTATHPATPSDHPRLRGEHVVYRPARTRVHGSPPPARGARGECGAAVVVLRITPACAGSTVECPWHR